MTPKKKALTLLDYVARPHTLWDGLPLNGKKRPSPFICCAIDEVAKKLGTEYAETANALKQVVREKIGGHASARTFYESGDGTITDHQLQVLRYGLIHHLITVFSEDDDGSPIFCVS